MKLLHIDSAITGDNSVSRQLSAAIVARLKDEVAGLEVVYRDLNAAPIGHLSGATFAAQAKDPSARTPQEAKDVTDGADALEEFMSADIVVIGAPMYNFALPTQLKAWIDRVAVAGKTFRYTENGPVGLAGGKRVIVASARGGFYDGTAMAALDHQESYLRTVFAFMGINEIEIVRAEGVATGPDNRASAITKAKAAIAAMAPKAAA